MNPFPTMAAQKGIGPILESRDQSSMWLFEKVYQHEGNGELVEDNERSRYVENLIEENKLKLLLQHRIYSVA